MASENEIRPLGHDTRLSGGLPTAGSCQVCGYALRSTRERVAHTCAYHLDVKKTPFNWR